MFICDDCLKKNYRNDPSLSRSRGKCEICEEFRNCNDIPSRARPGNGPVDPPGKELPRNPNSQCGYCNPRHPDFEKRQLGAHHAVDCPLYRSATVGPDANLWADRLREHLKPGNAAVRDAGTLEAVWDLAREIQNFQSIFRERLDRLELRMATIEKPVLETLKEILKGSPLPEARIRFREELVQLINRYSLENGSDTPDYILAEFLFQSLENLDKAIVVREKWYGRNMKHHPAETERQG